MPRYRIQPDEQKDIARLVAEKLPGATILEAEVLFPKNKPADSEFLVTLTRKTKRVVALIDIKKGTVEARESDGKTLRVTPTEFEVATKLAREALKAKAPELVLDNIRFDAVPVGIWTRDDRRTTHRVLSLFIRNKEGAYLHSPAVTVDLTKKEVRLGEKR